jgi:hypothetical protein
MEKMRLIDLLLLVADKKLKDGQMVLINNGCYKFNKKEEKFYVPTNFSEYRVIHTYDMNLTCYILSDYEELNKKD